MKKQMAIVMLVVIGLTAMVAQAAFVLNYTVVDLTGGVYGTTIGVSDGASLGAWGIDITILGAGGITIQQVKAYGAVQVDVEADADIYDPIGAANYDKELDTWVYDPLAEIGGGIVDAANSFRAQVGHTAGDHGDTDVLYVVTTGGTGTLSYSTQGGIGHGETEYTNISGSIPVPEPVTMLILLSGALVGLIRRRR